MNKNKKQTKHKIPDALQDVEAWELNRRKFLKGALLAGAMTQIGLFMSCTPELKKGNDILSAEQATILDDILLILFPNDGNGPSANDINAFGYIMWVLHDELNRQPEDNEYIIEGLDWMNEQSESFFEKKFVELQPKEKEELVAEIVQIKWGKNWTSMMITLLYEALLLDPIYGGNTNEVGWKWLNHVPGYPRPTEELRYERIMEKQMKIK